MKEISKQTLCFLDFGNNATIQSIIFMSVLGKCATHTYSHTILWIP